MSESHICRSREKSALLSLSDIALALHGYSFLLNSELHEGGFWRRGRVLWKRSTTLITRLLPSPRPEPFFCFVAADSRILLALLSPSSASPAGQHFSRGLAHTAEGRLASGATRGPIASPLILTSANTFCSCLTQSLVHLPFISNSFNVWWN